MLVWTRLLVFVLCFCSFFVYGFSIPVIFHTDKKLTVFFFFSFSRFFFPNPAQNLGRQMLNSIFFISFLHFLFDIPRIRFHMTRNIILLELVASPAKQIAQSAFSISLIMFEFRFRVAIVFFLSKNMIYLFTPQI